MKKFFALALSLALALTAFAGCSGTSASASTPSAASGSTASAGTAASGELNLYTWEGMFPQEVLDAFTAETGIKVNYSSFDTDETMLAKLETAKGGDYDVVIADDYIIETAIAEGLAHGAGQKQARQLSATSTPYTRASSYDPGGRLHRSLRRGRADHRLQPRSRWIWRSTATRTCGTPRWKDSLGITSQLPRDERHGAEDRRAKATTPRTWPPSRRAGAKLLELAPNIRLIKDDNLQDDLISGEISAGVMYTSQVTMACLANPDLKVVYPPRASASASWPSSFP